MDEFSALELAKFISTRLKAGLDDFAAESVTLTRDEAAVTLGIVNSVVEALELEAKKPN